MGEKTVVVRQGTVDEMTAHLIGGRRTGGTKLRQTAAEKPLRCPPLPPDHVIPEAENGALVETTTTARTGTRGETETEEDPESITTVHNNNTTTVVVVIMKIPEIIIIIIGMEADLVIPRPEAVEL